MNDDHHQGFGVYASETGHKMQLSMQELWLTGHILPVGARLVVRHQFRSQEAKPLEAIYAFALPRDAAMRSFRVVGEGFDINAALKPVDEARTAYEEGMEKGRLSALAQQYKDGLVNLSVGNIRPDETVTVFIEIAAGVSCTDTGFRFRFPFTLAPCYHPQAAAAEAEAGVGELALPESLFGDLMLPHWHENADQLHRVGFDVNLLLPTAEVEIASPSHPIAVRMGTPGNRARVSLAVSDDLPNRDLVLDARFALNEARVLAGMDNSGIGRFAALIPSSAFGSVKETSKKVVFLIDRSGSMAGHCFSQAKRATLACIAALRPEDRFGVVFFETSPTLFSGGCAEASQAHRDAARAFIKGTQTAGGTELAMGIKAAAKLLPEGGDILLLTDGQVYETEPIIRQAKRSGIRVHCLGIGSASQDRFLAQLARATDGSSHFAAPRERVDQAALQIFSHIGGAAAQGLQYTVSGLKQASLAPEPPAIARADCPQLIFGSCKAAGTGTLRCDWDDGHIEFPITVETADTENTPTLPNTIDATENLIVGANGETLKLLQGARITTELEIPGIESDNTARNKSRATKQLARNLAQTAEEYGLANPAMALVAVVKRKGDQANDLPVTRVVPVGMPQDTAFNAYFQATPGVLAESMASYSLMPAFLRKRTTPGTSRDLSLSAGATSSPFTSLCETQYNTEVNPSPDAALDDLFDLMGVLQADGGQPGKDAAERIARTLAALLALHTYDGEGFETHAARMTAFLRAQSFDNLRPEHNNAARRLLDALEKGAPPKGNWLAGYARKSDTFTPKALWKLLIKAAQAVAP